jgi:DNA adenine methylase
MALIRYPGSKEKLVDDLWELFPDAVTGSLFSATTRMEYREPFFGSGAIGFRILPMLHKSCRVWLNDVDADLVCLWESVQKYPIQLCKLVSKFTPSIERFYEFKAADGTPGESPERGLRKLALHRMSMSGFGVKSGGPIGGRAQAGAYTVECRWNPERIKRDITRLHDLLRYFDHCQITCGDFAPLIESATQNTFIYLDPPYYEKGDQLYKHPLNDLDHERLATALQQAAAAWVLSYDDHAEIRRLYSWARFTDLHITYTNAVTKEGFRPKNREVAITPN